MTTISLLCPSRGRPQLCKRMLQSAYATAANRDGVESLVLVDEDDPHLDEYCRLLPESRVIKGARHSGVARAFNALSGLASGDILFTAPDDLMFRTAGWDSIVREIVDRYADGIVVAVPYDGREGAQGERCTHWFTTRRWVERVGNFVEERYEHFYCDTHVADIAARSGRLVFMPEVLIEHMHPKYGKGQWDDTYKLKRKNGMSSRDKARYRELEPERARIAGALC
jgi:GT2 family glycosyltransferase